MGGLFGPGPRTLAGDFFARVIPWREVEPTGVAIFFGATVGEARSGEAPVAQASSLHHASASPNKGPDHPHAPVGKAPVSTGGTPAPQQPVAPASSLHKTVAVLTMLRVFLQRRLARPLDSQARRLRYGGTGSRNRFSPTMALRHKCRAPTGSGPQSPSPNARQ